MKEMVASSDVVIAHLPSPKPDLRPLTSLRFFAAFAVVIYHFARPALVGWPTPLTNLANSGYAAVSFFFLLSGFILAYSYLGEQATLRGSVQSFYAARFARIYPAYFVAFLLAVPWNVRASLHVHPGLSGWLHVGGNALAFLSLQQAWTPWTVWVWNYPAWSVSVETFFYLVFPWLGPRLVSRLSPRSCLQVCGSLWLVSLLAPAALVLLYGTQGAPELDDPLQKVVEFSPILRLPEFLIGILLGRAFRLRLFTRYIGRFAAHGALLGILTLLAFVPQIPHPLLANGLLVPLFAALILGFATHRTQLSSVLSHPTLVRLGEASYAIYILQIPISYVLRMPPAYQSLREFALYSSFLLVGSLLTFRYVEQPLREVLRKRLSDQPTVAHATANLSGHLPSIAASLVSPDGVSAKRW